MRSIELFQVDVSSRSLNTKEMSDLAHIDAPGTEGRNLPLDRYSLDIFHGAARVGFQGLNSGPVQLSELVLEVRALPVPFDLFGLRESLPNRSAHLSTLRARVMDRQCSSLLPRDMRLTALNGRLFLHGKSAHGGRFILEMVPRDSVKGGLLELSVVNIMFIGASPSAELGELLGLRSSSNRGLVRFDSDRNTLQISALSWLCGHALAKEGWKLPAVDAGLRLHLVCREGGLSVESVQRSGVAPLELGAEAPPSTMARLAGYQEALEGLMDARASAKSGRLDDAVALTARQIAAQDIHVADLCVAAASYLPATALLPWAKRTPGDFRNEVLVGNALSAQHDDLRAVESWLAAADLADPAKEPVYALELVRAVVARVTTLGSESASIYRRLMPLLSQLLERLPDNPEILELIASLSNRAPYPLRYAAFRSTMFSPDSSASASDQARGLLAEALERSEHEHVLELSGLIEAKFGKDPDALLLCAEALELIDHPSRAVRLWERLHEMAVVRGMEGLRETCTVALGSRGPEREVRDHLVALEPQIHGHPLATAAWLRRAQEHSGLVEAEHLVSALALIQRKALPSLVSVVRNLIRRREEMDLRARFVLLGLKLGFVRPTDLEIVDPRRTTEAVTRQLFRALRAFVGNDVDASAESDPLWNSMIGRSHGDETTLRAAVQGLIGRILFERYGRVNEAREHLQWAWDNGVRWPGIPEGLVEAALASDNWALAQEVLRAQLASEEDPERRVALGRRLMHKKPADSELHPQIVAILAEACHLVPWEDDLRGYLSISVGANDARPVLDTNQSKQSYTSPMVGNVLTNPELNEALTECRALVGRGSFDEAREILESLLSEDPECSEILVALAQIFEAEGNSGRAADLLLRRIEWVFDEEEARPLMIHTLDLLLASDRVAEAQKNLSEWSVMDPELGSYLPDRLRSLFQRIA
jgi:tetratricopeptide (TPR) repeat protein